jgi:hypothetical protein
MVPRPISISGEEHSHDVLVSDMQRLSGMRTRTSFLLSLGLLGVGCTAQPVGDATRISSTDSSLTGCHGQASSTIPADGTYDLTSFGGSSGSNGTMSCGENTDNGSWYYAASRQRYGCGSHIQITANGNCVVAETDDYGPDVCVEAAAGAPIIDASPLVAKALFGVTSAGWSDHFAIHVDVVDNSTPLGPCSASAPNTSTPDMGDPNAPAGPTDPTAPDMGDPNAPAPVTCDSYTLGITVDAGVCVQSVQDNDWYQCTSYGWEALNDPTDPDSGGLLGDCTGEYPLDQ